MEVEDLEVCTDCLLFIANGDTPEPTNDHHWSDDEPAEYPDGWESAALTERWDPSEGWRLCAGDGDGDEFSSSQCEACGSYLAGSRYPAHAMREVAS